MLSTLVQRQKIWIMPLLISMAFSWCFMLCQNLAQASTHLPSDSALPQQVLVTPPCHSKFVEITDESNTAESTALSSEPCSGCEQHAAAAAESVTLVLVAVLISWLGLTAYDLPATTIPAIALATPPPRTAVPLYLGKNLLLI